MKLHLSCGVNGFYDNAGKFICTGAKMGRSDVLPENNNPIKLYLQKMEMVDYAYDMGGAYWGTGLPLYCAFSNNPFVQIFIRANNRNDAKSIICEKLPFVSFYR